VFCLYFSSFSLFFKVREWRYAYFGEENLLVEELGGEVTGVRVCGVTAGLAVRRFGGVEGIP
jgi:hypothetical protein